jgi:hypothetical protein
MIHENLHSVQAEYDRPGDLLETYSEADLSRNQIDDLNKSSDLYQFADHRQDPKRRSLERVTQEATESFEGVPGIGYQELTGPPGYQNTVSTGEYTRQIVG